MLQYGLLLEFENTMYI